MGVTILFHTNDSWYKHRIIWSGIYSASGVTLFGDSFSHNIVGQHASTISGYPNGVTVSLTRLETSGNLAVAGSQPSGIPYTIVGPETTVDGGAMANYLDEFSTAMGSVYIETSPPSGWHSISGGGNLHWHPLYPPSGGGWYFATSGIGHNLDDVVGLDYPDNPRVLISSPELANASGRPAGIWVVNVASGGDQTFIYETVYSPDIAENIYITDLEAQRILG